MKQDGAFGKMYGKIGNIVYSIQRGVQISRQYNSQVTNPNTVSQTNQRARFKLASQLAAAMSSVIVIPAKQLQTPRNLFVKRNINNIYAGDGQASAVLNQLQITAGSLSLPGIYIERDRDSSDVRLRFGLSSPASLDIKRVVYNVFEVLGDGTLTLRASEWREGDSNNRYFDVDIANIEGTLAIYAYGIKDNNERATANFGRYSIEDGQSVARLFTQRKLKQTDYSFTETKSNIIQSNEDTADVPSAGSVLVDVSINGPGSVTITSPAGKTLVNGKVNLPANTSVTLECTFAPGYRVDGWYRVGEQTPISTASTLTFTAGEDTYLMLVVVPEGLE